MALAGRRNNEDDRDGNLENVSSFKQGRNYIYIALYSTSKDKDEAIYYQLPIQPGN
jgi:hypothetical protein